MYRTGDFLVHKVCERAFDKWWYMHEMVVLVRFQIDLFGSQNFFLKYALIDHFMHNPPHAKDSFTNFLH